MGGRGNSSSSTYGVFMVAFWDWLQWLFFPLYRLGWTKPMGWAHVNYCKAAANDAFRKYGKSD
jgi:hypothetical protein